MTALPQIQETTLILSEKLNVQARLRNLRQWRTEFDNEDAMLLNLIDALDDMNKQDIQRGVQLTTLKNALRVKLAREPLELDVDTLRAMGYQTLQQMLKSQYSSLSLDSKKLWLQNLSFILTPDLRRLYDKLVAVRRYSSLGQQRNFLLGGVSGMGKTTCLDWLTYNNMPTVGVEANRVPIVKIDAPQSNRDKKQLLKQMVLQCGRAYIGRDTEGDLLDKVTVYFQKCRVELLIVDEIQHLKTHDMRRHLLEISNRIKGVPIVCASTNPTEFTEDDSEIRGRWNDYFELKQFTGEALTGLLMYIELLLPFTSPSNLAEWTIKSGTKRQDGRDGAAKFIETRTHGVLRDIMILVADASIRALERGLPNLTVELLEEAWSDIRNQQVTDFLKIIKKPENQSR